MRKISIGVVIVMAIVSGTSCSVNIMQSFGDELSNDALYDEALILNDAGDYDTALTKLAEMTPEYQAKEKVIVLYAKLKAGKCGLSFLDFVEALDNGFGTTNFFIFLMNQFRAGTVAKAGFCKEAEDAIEQLGATPVTRTQEQNLLITLISFAKLGNWLSFYADANNNLAVDDIDFCNDPTDAHVREMGTAINIAIQSIANSGLTSIAGYITNVNTLCTNIDALDTTYNFCNPAIYNPATFTANQLLGIRSMIRSGPANNAIGIYSCNQASDVPGCGVPLCP